MRAQPSRTSKQRGFPYRELARRLAAGGIDVDSVHRANLTLVRTTARMQSWRIPPLDAAALELATAPLRGQLYLCWSRQARHMA